MTRPKYDSWALESSDIEEEILRSLRRHDAVPPKSERKLTPVVIPSAAALIEDLTEKELEATPFWKNWEEHIHDPAKDCESVPARPSVKRGQV